MLRSCLVAVVLLAVAVPSLAQPMANHVPGDAVVYVGWAGAGSMGEPYAASHLKAVVDRSDWGDLFTRFVPQVIRKAGQADRDAAEASRLLSAIAQPMWQHPSAFYFGGIDFTDPRRPQPKIAFYCDAGDDAAALVRSVNDAIARAPRRGGAPAMAVTANEGLVTVTIGSVPAAGTPVLAASAGLKAVANVGHATPVSLVYVDGRQLMKLGDDLVANGPNPQAAERWPAVREALGLNGFESLVISNAFEGRNWSTFAHVRAPGQRAGLLKFLDAKPLSTAIVTSVPDTAVLASVGSFDVAGLLDGIRDAGTKVSPDFAQNYGAAMGYLGGMIGVEVRDLVEPLGNEWAFYQDPTVGGTSLLGTVGINRLDDPAAARDLFSKAEQGINRSIAQHMRGKEVTVRFKTTSRDGVDIHYLATPMVTPAWAIEGDKLYLGLYPQTVASAVARAKAGGRSMVDNPAYTATRSALGDQAATAVQFMDVPKLVPQSYATWVLLTRYAGFGDLFGIDSPLMLVPPLHELAPHLSPAGAVQWTDASGWYARSISSFPGSQTLATDPVSSIMTAQPAFLLSVLLPSLNRARETANRVKSASNLRQIGQGMLLYANENRGKYPDDLGEILITQDLGIEAFVNPRRGTVVPPEVLRGDVNAKADWIETNGDYGYKGAGKNNRANPDVVMAYERPEGLSDGLNVLFGDGHVEFVAPMARARQMVGE